MTVAPPSSALPASPCLGVCEIDAGTGYCRGCARTADEVAAWRDAPDAFRDAVWRELPGRVAALGIRLRRLPWSPAGILDFVEAGLRDATGAWVMGMHGATGAFRRDPEEECAIRRGNGLVEAVTARGGLRLAVGASTRAFAHADGRILLVLPRVRLPAPGPAMLTALGPDAEAIRPEDRDGQRFDLGLGRSAVRFTVRTAERALAADLAAVTGQAFPGHLALTGRLLREAGPARVIESPLGRMEVVAPVTRRDTDVQASRRDRGGAARATEDRTVSVNWLTLDAPFHWLAWTGLVSKRSRAEQLTPMPWRRRPTSDAAGISEADQLLADSSACGQISARDAAGSASPVAGGPFASGPHTDLRPALLALGRELPDIDLPPAFAVGALFQPA